MGQMGQIQVLRAGLLSTLQDAGRCARSEGISMAGAADSEAYALANALVGNTAGALALEVTALGPKLVFRTRAVISVCGAPFEVSLDGQPVPLWKALDVQAGQCLSIGSTAAGLRAVLAIRGGFVGQEVFGSASTDLRAGFGGFQGRQLKKNDVLNWHAQPAQDMSDQVVSSAMIPPDWRSRIGPKHLVRILPLPEATLGILKLLTEQTLTVSTQADRLGVRLNERLPLATSASRPSLPNLPGALQIPPDGCPIVLLPDAGTHGGYVTPVAVCMADLPMLAQWRPHDLIRFQLVTPTQAVAALKQRQGALKKMMSGLRVYHSVG